MSEVEISEDHARHLVEDDGAYEAELEDRKEHRLIADAVWLL